MAKLLLVEDDNNLREIYEARLQAEGYQIVSAKDGEEALVVAKAEKPDLVISDVMMPKISGFEMLDILRNTDELKHVKVIMLTALGQSDDQKRADKLGADRYLVKSQVTLEDIVKAAHDLLGDEGEAAGGAPAADDAATASSAPDTAAATDTPAADEPVAEPAPAPEPAPEPAAEPEESDDKPKPDTEASADASSKEAEPTAQEEAGVEAKIEDFVTGATTEAPPPAVPDASAPADDTSSTETTVKPTEPAEPVAEPVAAPAAAEPKPETDTPAKPVSDDDKASDDKLMADAVDTLVASTDESEPSATAATDVPAPDTATAADTPAAPAPEPSADSAGDKPKATAIPVTTDADDEPAADAPAPEPTEDKNEEGGGSSKKVIKPLDSAPKKDIRELLAEEESKEAQTVPGTTITATAGTANEEDKPSGAPMTPPSEASDDAPAADKPDPNSIAL